VVNCVVHKKYEDRELVESVLGVLESAVGVSLLLKEVDVLKMLQVTHNQLMV
jgi:hypothetical protein